ncbi:MAG: hypothetical protein NUW01_19780 [Gemmatimonadaceae bacterium]|nr:hypothetical protein [Gemmatimonadaceae bacterium]
MAEPVNGTHPDAAELQSHADGETLDERVAAHIESCASCREEVAAIRRVTAALSLGSRPSDSLTEKIRARRAESAQGAPVAPLRARRTRFRTFLLPVGLAAAAALALFVPRAWRERAPDERSPAAGAKGAPPLDIVVDEAIVTETGATSIDSVSWEISGPGITAELRYVTGRAESPGAARLAERVVERLMEAGLERSSIAVRPAPARETNRPLPPGAVGVTLLRRAP